MLRQQAFISQQLLQRDLEQLVVRIDIRIGRVGLPDTNSFDQALLKLFPAKRFGFMQGHRHAKHAALPGRIEYDFAVRHRWLQRTGQNLFEFIMAGLGHANTSTPIMLLRVTRRASSPALRVVHAAGCWGKTM